MAIQQIDETALYEKHVKIRPRPVKGRFQNLRLTAVLVLLGIFHLLPFLMWNGRQAIWFDMPHRRFYIFGLNIWPQDFILLSFILLGLALTLFCVTAILGRVWCGYACPHTVYTEVFLWLEQKIEGNRSEQLKLARRPWDAVKIRKRFLKYFLWVAFALITGLGFVGYFVPIRQLIPDFFTLNASKSAYFWVWFYGTFCYLQAGIVREQFCKYICPYARFQGAMFDRDTLIIAYDEKRGEPRRRLKRQDRESGDLGFCVDCTMCVQVCPTGIDIRDGLQVECIACAACIDACDNMMDQIKAPRGLIRYTSTVALENNHSKTRILRPKTIGYMVVLSLALSALVTFAFKKSDIDLNVIADRNAMGRKLPNQEIQNVYVAKILNKTERTRVFRFEVEGVDGIYLSPQMEVEALPNQVKDVVLRINAPRQAMDGRDQIIVLKVVPQDAPEQSAEKKTQFAYSRH